MKRGAIPMRRLLLVISLHVIAGVVLQERLIPTRRQPIVISPLPLNAPVSAKREATVPETLKSYYQALDSALKNKDAKRGITLSHQFETPNFKTILSDGTALHPHAAEDNTWMVRSVRRV